MDWQFSEFGQHLGGPTGIQSLMDDLTEALGQNDTSYIMLGGGNPAHIEEFEALIASKLQNIASNKEKLRQFIGIYDPPAGNIAFRQQIAALLRENFHWPIDENNISLTHGSQHSFFLLFNSLAGRFSNGSSKKILLPIVPEYIGYWDIGLDDNFFACASAKISYPSDHRFKYHVDFDHLPLTTDIAAMCISRPTNPSGNVISNEEVKQLSELSQANHIPLIIDNAYGSPFPELIYINSQLEYYDNIIYCMSLSKLGLPSLRTGIIIAPPTMTGHISRLNSLISLSPNSTGSVLASELFSDNNILDIVHQIIHPFYLKKQQIAIEILESALQGVNYLLHQPEGAMFLWLYFPDLKISSRELYQRLKKRGVLVISGHFFFPQKISLPNDHREKCLRISFARESVENLQRAFSILAEEVS